MSVLFSLTSWWVWSFPPAGSCVEDEADRLEACDEEAVHAGTCGEAAAVAETTSCQQKLDLYLVVNWNLN